MERDVGLSSTDSEEIVEQQQQLQQQQLQQQLEDDVKDDSVPPDQQPQEEQPGACYCWRFHITLSLTTILTENSQILHSFRHAFGIVLPL